MTFEAVLFDLDDTLLNGKKAARTFTENLALTYKDNLTFSDREEFIKNILNEDNKFFCSREELFVKLYKGFPWIKTPAVSEILNFWCSEYPKAAEPVEGLYETLTTLLKNNVKIAIVTNGPTEFQKAKIKKLGLSEYFKTIIISEEVGLRKPDKAIFELALKKIGAKKETSLFVGDNPQNDIFGAQNAEISTFWVSNGLIWKETDFKPDFIGKNISELIEKVNES